MLKSTNSNIESESSKISVYSKSDDKKPDCNEIRVDQEIIDIINRASKKDFEKRFQFPKKKR